MGALDDPRAPMLTQSLWGVRAMGAAAAAILLPMAQARRMPTELDLRPTIAMARAMGAAMGQLRLAQDQAQVPTSLRLP